MDKAQGAMEFLLIIGGVIVLALVVIGIIFSGILAPVEDDANQGLGGFFDFIDSKEGKLTMMDGSDTINWDSYTTPPGTISTVFDSDLGSDVIEFSGPSGAGYIIGDDMTGSNGNDESWGSTKKQISWKMKYSGNYTIYVSVTVADPLPSGTYPTERYITYNYDGSHGDNPPSGPYIPIALPEPDDGEWHTITQNLEDDLQSLEYESTNTIVTVNGFKIRGNGKIDEITLK